MASYVTVICQYSVTFVDVSLGIRWKNKLYGQGSHSSYK
jgi:hypothetical protein